MSSAAVPASPRRDPPGVRGLPATVARLTRPVPSWYARVHPVRWLRWLRAGMLALILVAALLCLLVTYQAHREITIAAGHGAEAIAELNAAHLGLTAADTAVASSFRTGDVALVGPGAAYEDAITTASQQLVLAAENNVAGIQGANKIQFAEGLLVTYTDLVQQASTDFAGSGGGRTLAMAELGYASGLLHQKGGILYVLNDLRRAEQATVTADLRSRWLGPGDFWWLLLAPFLAMLLLAAGTSYVLWHGFRRALSVRLTAALVLTLGLVVLVASLNVHDGGQAKAYIDSRLASRTQLTLAEATDATGAGLAYSPWTLAAGLVLAGGASILAYSSYWPRLYEYRYRP